jgi:saccharopine dehydrogenase (NAD+, L-lysine forming)
MRNTLGIRREDKSRWERRAPLAPEHVKALREQHGVAVVVQPSPLRIFTDEEYRQAGATIDEDLSGCNLVVAVKEIPTKLLRRQGNYMYFSHTAKGQPYNMPMLRHLLHEGCTLLDHEKVTDDDGRRLVLFGVHAGLAGMIDSLWALGRRFAAEGHDTALAAIEPAHTRGSLAATEERLREVGARLARDGLPKALGPVVVGVTGYGNVSKGAQHILDLLGPVTIQPADLAGALEPGRLYKVVFKEEHTVTPIDPAETFHLRTYFDHPERFRSSFDGYLPRLTVLVNCIYWEARYPRLVTNERLRALFIPGGPQPALRVIGDISCDVEGSIEATVKCTQPDAPVYVFDPHGARAIDGVEGHGPVIMAVDNLPCELPREATVSFGDALAPLVSHGAKADFEASFDALALPPELRRAVVVHRGELTPAYRYLEKHVR